MAYFEFGACGINVDRMVVLSLSHLSTIRLLRQWARFGSTDSLGYPRHAAHETLRITSSLYGSTHIPSEIAEVEAIICELPYVWRDALIQRYQRHATWAAIAARFGNSWRTAKKITIEAEDEVHAKLNNTSRQRVGGNGNFVPPCITVT